MNMSRRELMTRRRARRAAVQPAVARGSLGPGSRESQAVQSEDYRAENIPGRADGFAGSLHLRQDLHEPGPCRPGVGDTKQQRSVNRRRDQRVHARSGWSRPDADRGDLGRSLRRSSLAGRSVDRCAERSRHRVMGHPRSGAGPTDLQTAGGPIHEKVRVYGGSGGTTPDSWAKTKADGYTATRVSWPTGSITEMIEYTKAMRKAAGPKHEIAIHGAGPSADGRSTSVHERC